MNRLGGFESALQRRAESQENVISGGRDAGMAVRLLSLLLSTLSFSSLTLHIQSVAAF